MASVSRRVRVALVALLLGAMAIAAIDGGGTIGGGASRAPGVSAIDGGNGGGGGTTIPPGLADGPGPMPCFPGFPC